MGYCSNVHIIAIAPRKSLAQFLLELTPAVMKNSPKDSSWALLPEQWEYRHYDEEYCIRSVSKPRALPISVFSLKWDGIKWSNTSSWFLPALLGPAVCYNFCRVGEERGDVEQEVVIADPPDLQKAFTKKLVPTDKHSSALHDMLDQLMYEVLQIETHIVPEITQLLPARNPSVVPECKYKGLIEKHLQTEPRGMYYDDVASVHQIDDMTVMLLRLGELSSGGGGTQVRYCPWHRVMVGDSVFQVQSAFFVDLAKEVFGNKKHRWIQTIVDAMAAQSL